MPNRLTPVPVELQNVILNLVVRNNHCSCWSVEWVLENNGYSGISSGYLKNYQDHSLASSDRVGFRDLPNWLYLTIPEMQDIRVNRLKAWFKSLEENQNEQGTVTPTTPA